jgi:hypothetical protein
MKKLKAATLLFVLMIAMIGQASAATQIIILGIDSDPGQIRVSYLLWTVTASPIPNPGAVSIWTGATAAQNAAIAAGTTIETQRVLSVPAGTSKAVIQAQLVAIFTATQTVVTAVSSGCTYNGTIWSC